MAPSITAKTSRGVRWVLAAACGFGVLSILAICAASSMGFLRLSPSHVVGLAVIIGLMVLAGLMLVLEAVSSSYGRDELHYDEGLSTITVPPAPLGSQKPRRRDHLTLIK